MKNLFILIILFLNFLLVAQGNPMDYYTDPKPYMLNDPIIPVSTNNNTNQSQQPADENPSAQQMMDGPKYEDCQIQNGFAIEPGQKIDGYKCRITRNQDVIPNDTSLNDDGTVNNLLLQALRKNLLGLETAALSTGRPANEKCYRQISYNPLTNITFKMFDKDTEQVIEGHNVNKSLATPRFPQSVVTSERLQFISLGCQSNRCAAPVSNQSAPLSEYICMPRYSYRCLESGEQTPSDSECCDGLIKNDQGLCQEPELVEESILEGFPNHVDSTTGLINFSADPDKRNLVQAKLTSATALVRAFEFFFSQQNLGTRKALKDNHVMKDIGIAFKEKSLAALQRYNEDLSELEEIKNSFIQLSKQSSDPEAYFNTQVGGVSYRKTKFSSPEQFRNFVQNANSGVEIFRFMAEEQKILLAYEYSLYHALKEAVFGPNGNPNLSIIYLMQEWSRQRSGRRGQRTAFGKPFTSRYRHWLWGRRPFRKRFQSNYRFWGQATLKMFQMRSAASWSRNIFSYTPQTNEARSLKEIESKKVGFHKKRGILGMIEIPHIGNMKFEDYGSRKRYWFLGSSRRKRIIYRESDVTKMYDNFYANYRKYLKENYFEKDYEIFDISFGGIKSCLTENDFPIKDTEQCSRYKTSVEISEKLAMESFLASSEGGWKLRTGSINRKTEFFFRQAIQLTHTMGIYEHMSAIPSELGGLAFLGNQSLNFKELFEKYNEKVPGFLRLKSYLFYMAKAKDLAAETAETGIASGDEYTPSELYGSGNNLVIYENTQAQTGQQQAAAELSSSASSNGAATNTGGIITSSNQGGESSGIASGKTKALTSDYSRSLAKLNKSALDFAQKNPKTRKRLQQLVNQKKERLNKSRVALASQINSGEVSNGSLSSISTPGLKKSNKALKRNIVSNISKFTQTNNDYSNKSLYKESPSNEKQSQLTSLSDYQLKQAIKNSKDQAHLYKSSEYDGIFEKISKTYARSYSKFLVKKTRNGDSSQLKESKNELDAIKDKAKVMKMLNGF